MSSNQPHSPSPLGPGAHQAGTQQQSGQGAPATPTRHHSRRPNNEAIYWHRRNMEARRQEQAQTDPGPSSGSSVLAGEGAGAGPDVTLGVAPGLTPCPVPILRISRHYRPDPSPSHMRRPPSAGERGPSSLDPSPSQLRRPSYASERSSASRSTEGDEARTHYHQQNNLGDGGVVDHLDRPDGHYVESHRQRPYTETPQAEEDIPMSGENRLTVRQQAGQGTRMSAENRLTVRQQIPTHVENRRERQYVDTFQGESDIPMPSLLPWATTHRVQQPVGVPYFTPLAGGVVYYNWNRVPDSNGNVPTYFTVYPPASASSPPRLATIEENQNAAPLVVPNIRMTLTGQPGVNHGQASNPAAAGQAGRPISDNVYTLDILANHVLPNHIGQSSSSSGDEEESRETPAHTLDGANDVETPGGAHDGAVPEDSAAYTLITSAQDGVATRGEDARPVFSPVNPFVGNPLPHIPAAAFSGTFQERLQFLIAATEPALLLSVEELWDYFREANGSRPQDAGAADEAGEPSAAGEANRPGEPGPSLIIAVEEAAAAGPSTVNGAGTTGDGGPVFLGTVDKPVAAEPPAAHEASGAREPGPAIIFAIEDAATSDLLSGRAFANARKSARVSETKAPGAVSAEPSATNEAGTTGGTGVLNQVAIDEAATGDAVTERAAVAKAQEATSTSKTKAPGVVTTKPAAVVKAQESATASKTKAPGVATAKPAAVVETQESVPVGKTKGPGAVTAKPAAVVKAPGSAATSNTEAPGVATTAEKTKKKSSTAAAAVANAVRNFGRRRAADPADQGKHSTNSTRNTDDAHNPGRRGAAGSADHVKHPNNSTHEIGNDGAADVIYELRSGHAPSSLSDCNSSYSQVRFTYDIDKDPHIRIRRLQQQSSAPSDIRSQIAPANDLGKDMNGRFVRYNWTEEPEETKNFLSSTTFLGRAIGHWRESVPNLFYGGSSLGDGPDVEKFTALLAEKIDCDVNPQDLALQTPYVTRDSPADPNDAGRLQDAPRERMYSSFEKRKQERAAKRALSGMYYYSKAEVDELGLGASGQSAPKVQSFEPDVTCYLRPASKKDVGNIQTIYNHEVTHGTQSRDIHTVSVTDVASTLDMCKAGNLPFIVAIAGLEHDIREPKGPTKKWQTGEPENGELLGFALLSNYHVGLCGATDATGGSSVRLTIVVHPQHRRKFIGHALMDKMLHLLCPNYAYQDTAAFVDHEVSPAHRGPGFAPRVFRHVLVETMVREGDQRSSDGFAQFLGSRFGFSKLFELKQSHDHRGSLYNQTTWHREIRPAQPAQ